MANKKKPLSVTHPELAAQADGWDPTTVTYGSSKKVRWKCKDGHSWMATVAGRTAGNKCPVCANQIVQVGYNDLATTHPEIAKEADGWDPTTLTAGSGKKVGWKCAIEHHFLSAPVDRLRGRGCPFCSNNQVLVGYNDLATTHPEIAKEADGWNPRNVTYGNKQRLSWKCELNHQWFASPNNRTSHLSGCPFCVGKRAWPGFNDIATTHPEIAKEADGWDPKEFVIRSHKRLPWRCTLGHLYTIAPEERLRGRGCPICAGKQVLKGFNDLASRFPELAEQADGWDPESVTFGSTKIVQWRCQLGHQFSTLVNARTSTKSLGNGCPYCSGNTVLVGFNDLATLNPELAAQAHGWDPTTLTAGSSRKVAWKCLQGHSWKSRVKDRSQGVGCPTCAPSGFDPNLDGWLYFIDNDALSMFQIGISNYPDNRLSQHQKRGWEVIEVRGPMDGHLTQRLETAILHAVERRGAVLGHKAQVEKFDGYSEAWTKDSLEVPSLKQLLDWVYEDDD